MKVLSIYADGFGNLDKVKVDLESLPGGLVAISGPNGSGKTHLLSCLFEAPIYRTLEYYDSWVQAHFSAEGGEIVTRYNLRGKEYTIKITGKRDATPSCYLYEGDICIAGPEVRSFSKEIQRIFPSQEMTLASRCASQHDPLGFFGLTKEARHKAFASMLGIDKHASLLSHLGARISATNAAIKAREKSAAAIGDMADISKRLGSMKENLVIAQVGLENLEDLAKKDPEPEPPVGIDEINENIASYKKEIQAIEAADKKLYAILIELDRQWSQIKDTLRDDETKRLRVANRLKAAEARRERVLEGMKGVDMGLEICRLCPLTAEVPAADAEYEKALSESMDVLAACLTDDERKKLHQELSEIPQKISDTKASKEELAVQGRCMSATLSGALERLAELSNKHMEWSRRARDRATYQLSGTKEVASLQEGIRTLENKLADLKVVTDELSDLAKDRSLYGELESAIRTDRTSLITTILPRIQAVANEILEGYADGRFQLLISHEKAQKASGAVTENFDPEIVDTLTGDIRSRLSGGQQIIISEAIRMAFSIAEAEVSGTPGGTLSRDEVMSSLDAESIDPYLDILRKGIDIGGFDRILFVCHMPEVHKKADAIIHLNEGRVTEVET